MRPPRPSKTSETDLLPTRRPSPLPPLSPTFVLYAATKHTATQDFQVGRELALRKQASKENDMESPPQAELSPYKDGVWTHTTFRQSLKVKVRCEVELAKQCDFQGREVSSRCQR